jgi:hypothetical protein
VRGLKMMRQVEVTRFFRLRQRPAGVAHFGLGSIGMRTPLPVASAMLAL